MKPIRFLSDAFEDAQQARDYLESKETGLSLEFDQDLADALARIQNQPKLFPVERGQVRRCVLSRFSYSALYAELAEEILIIAIAHHRMRRGFWHRRRFT